MTLHLTPSQTVGPFFHGGLLREGLNLLATETTEGERIRIQGRVCDGDGAGVPDAVVEIWQANAGGRYHHPADGRAIRLDDGFTGFGRAETDRNGFYWFETVKPGPVPFDDEGDQAPHINVAVFARGLLDHLPTRLYFADEASNRTDPVLRQVPEDRRSTLLATRESAGDQVVYRFDIVLQGDAETVFFDL